MIIVKNMNYEGNIKVWKIFNIKTAARNERAAVSFKFRNYAVTFSSISTSPKVSPSERATYTAQAASPVANFPLN
jgi:hypothetical protein